METEVVIDFQADLDRWLDTAKMYMNRRDARYAAYFARLTARAAFMLHPELRKESQ